MTLYLDTSAIFKLYVDERGSAAMRQAVVPGGRLATSLLSYVEAVAAFARRRRTGDLTPADHRRVVEEFSDDWERFVRIEVTEPLVLRAARLAETYRLRAYDALHLASALVLRESTSEVPTFACWDDQLDAAAAREGLPLLRAG